MIAIVAWIMIIVFMALILTKKMHPFSAIVFIPVAFAVLGSFLGLFREAAAATLETSVENVGIWEQIECIAQWARSGMTQTSSTAFMLFFAIMFFSLMLNAGLFDPLTKTIIRLAKGDPLRVLVGTSVLAAIVSLSGDGTTTTLICCTALIPIYKKLNLKLMDLAMLLILQNTILNLLPWSGPTARVVAVIDGIDVQSLMRGLMPGMIVAILFVIGVAFYRGIQERRRLGIQQLSQEEMDVIFAQIDETDAQLKRPKMAIWNAILTVLSLVLLIAGVLNSVFIFLIGTVIALMINFPQTSAQKERLHANAGEVLQTVIMVIGAGVFMGVFTSSGMSDALAGSLVSVIPASLGRYWGLIVTLISAPGGFFLSNDAFFYGVLPVLLEAGRQYGFTSFQIGYASLLGQAFHMLSPLTAFIYLLLSMTEQDMGEWQRTCFKYTVGIFIIFIACALLLGYVPLIA